MSLTLWRGDHPLGELRLRAPGPHDQRRRRDEPPSLSAFLVAAPGARLTGVWQVSQSIPGFDAVHQFPLEPDVPAERGRRGATGQVNPGPIALQRMTPQEARGVPREVQLTVHDAEGRVYLPRQVRLEVVHHEPTQPESDFGQIPAEAVVDGSVWCAFVVFASDREAPGT